MIRLVDIGNNVYYFLAAAQEGNNHQHTGIGEYNETMSDDQQLFLFGDDDNSLPLSISVTSVASITYVTSGGGGGGGGPEAGMKPIQLLCSLCRPTVDKDLHPAVLKAN